MAMVTLRASKYSLWMSRTTVSSYHRDVSLLARFVCLSSPSPKPGPNAHSGRTIYQQVSRWPVIQNDGIAECGCIPSQCSEMQGGGLNSSECLSLSFP